MQIIQPARSTFWRFLMAIVMILSFASLGQLFDLARKLDIVISMSRSWMGLSAVFGLAGIFSLLALTLTWSRYQEQILSLMEFPMRFLAGMRWLNVLFLVVSLTGFAICVAYPPVRRLFGNADWIRYFIFLCFNILGVLAFKSMRQDTHWFTVFLAVFLSQSVLHLLVIYWIRVTDYPFAMGWSETSRHYYPSLFLSETVYGQPYPLPILHPTLHILLAPPYLFDAPLWVHRLWQVVIRYALVGAVVPVLLKRLFVQESATRWLTGLWMYLFLFMGPVYFHLTIPILILLWGFSAQGDRKTWFAVLAASIWCGWSRVNWYPMPGMIAAVLYLLEVPLGGKSLWNYLIKPALWFIMGTLTAFIFQRIYIAVSGVPDGNLFYTSLTSDLLWYRLLPNTSYFLGILPAALLASLPVWFAMFIVIRSGKDGWHPLRLFLIFAALFVLFLGGLVVSLKIGGGANLHNMDAYFSLLLIVFGYLVFARYRREDGGMGMQVRLHWLVVVSLILMPAWSYLQFNIGSFKTYDTARTHEVMDALQGAVDRANSQGGEILFVTQRHLISMHMLKNVKLVYEYEREDLMELAMSNNVQYLGELERDMQDQRFALIVVDPLNFNILSKNRSFSEENNVWITRVMKPILCNYREEAVFPEDEIALYVPQEGERQCPE